MWQLSAYPLFIRCRLGRGQPIKVDKRMVRARHALICGVEHTPFIYCREGRRGRVAVIRLSAYPLFIRCRMRLVTPYENTRARESRVIILDNLMESFCFWFSFWQTVSNQTFWACKKSRL
ncbi:MAG: hypothetical protein EXR62_00070 [Chloroflexi bacterium]|nr:hypothetical protein [Chloroflexota bacterium]